ncbi:family 10 glycosylhydrolase [Candidatus Sumerlaeota bacterium]|nr:family 10 glycosylhydrolase [Candidatus Sumerlaeota bacterium]
MLRRLFLPRFFFFHRICLILLLPSLSFSQVVIADAVKWRHKDGSGVAEIITDNSGPLFFTNGAWTPGSFPGGYGGDYLYTSVSDSSSRYAYWAAEIPVAGEYDIFVYYTSGANRFSQTHYYIGYSGGFPLVTIDQTTGGDWEPLGRYNLETGKNMVLLSPRISEGLIDDMIVDNGDPLFSTSGGWTTGTVTLGYNDDYLFAGCSATSSSIAIWEMPMLESGNYEIRVWFSTGSNRNDKVPYLIYARNGTKERVLPQNIGEHGWRSLGVYPFDAGINKVIVSNEGTPGKVVIADAAIALYMGNEDAIPPEITLLNEDVPTPAARQPISVRVFIWSFDEISSVTATSWNSPEKKVEASLYDDGMHGDDNAGDMIFGGEIPSGDAGSVFEYHVCASTVNGAAACTQDYECLVAYDEFTSPELRLAFAYSANTPEKIDILLHRIRNGNFNALCFGVRGIADAYYNSSYEPWASGIPAGFDPLGYLVEKAHDTSEGKAYIQVHPLALVYRVLTTDTPPPGHVLDLHPEWISENYAGDQFIVDRMYMDQGIPEVQDYLINVFMEIVENYDIDGFNLDFIRYRGQDCGYNPIALKYFHQFTGRSDRPLKDDPEWSAWRRARVTNFVKRMYANILKVKPHVILTIDGVCRGKPEDDMELNNFYWNVFQDYPLWLENHYIDGVLGMAYRCEDDPALAKEFDDWTTFLKILEGDRRAVPIVGAYQNSIQHTLVQLHRLRQSGADWLSAFALGSPDNLGIGPDAFTSATRSQIFPTPVMVPELPWKKDNAKGVLMGRAWFYNEPQRLVKISLGSENAYTDLCGFFVFFDLNPASLTLRLYDNNDNIKYETEINIPPGAVVEHNIRLSSNLMMMR